MDSCIASALTDSPGATSAVVTKVEYTQLPMEAKLSKKRKENLVTEAGL